LGVNGKHSENSFEFRVSSSELRRMKFFRIDFILWVLNS
jgi:hypothetical protein